MRRREATSTALLLAFLQAGTACVFGGAAGEAEGDEADIEVAGLATNGTTMNGAAINGRYLNGVYLNGRYLNGRYLNGVALNGRYLNGATLNGSELVATDDAGTLVGGESMVGATIQAGETIDGEPVTLRVDAIDWGPGDLADVTYYRFSYKLEGFSGWYPVCTDVFDQPTRAILLAGRWDYREGVAGGGSHIADPYAVTIACTGAALAKCVELGYKPWDESGLPMADMHQSCTRMLRADYCGTGEPSTSDGWQINVWDAYGVQASDANLIDFRFDAEWGPDGAVCLREARNTGICFGSECSPREGRYTECGADIMTPDCGDAFELGQSFLMDEAWQNYNASGAH